MAKEKLKVQYLNKKSDNILASVMQGLNECKCEGKGWHLQECKRERREA